MIYLLTTGNSKFKGNQMNYQIIYEKNPKSKDIQALNDGIMEQAKQKKGMKQPDFFVFFIRDEIGKVIGGCVG